ncbi:3-methyl-2-oxobutanoate hydroxymethyltransferase [Halalkalibacterium halodurans]|jgi:3-methyl-2-oxobutanoate hydroxymethyltransferase|uniref:3-methyl-2-oxobutanoate hydroxymethyltransferase n=1 Tax=Halalkalibacterium halodurans TaxID=86665 RepID=A0A0M0KL46_ALKHA|nr:3-methyl-2-oxobutanoate hydroxymethyltransferase [Halalkalibacterium halodurans]MDY7222257.1 3-methyl-2-oxobutanoate hydroxymethyltransferase [Halalkalibacterium halodurans]MDY7241478.1 3-methyl-2-oxobutanoate hydroxymethyltransferase [Halalkalibacterium halodurans]MED3646060.1 3-methyl-2-oxobutanoate hydroxymethyltransferase [Halalkalibacterium halodurans]TES57763.1 3-methyl-2-oxobutanoate hydroxymethyltransferase [Halalkalibacterium halodurans]TPE70822.1 3-methyl-2-oxobutanoate hydroxymet
MKTTASFKKMKQQKEKIAMMTAYDAPSARLVEDADVDMILVGDSLGMVVLGYDSTIPVTLDDMIHHTKAVKRGAKNTFIVTDMPYLTYHGSFNETLVGAKRLMQEAGADALKLEGNGDIIETIERLTLAGVPIVAHLGLTPQNVAVEGGYRVQAKDAKSAKQLLADAKAVEAAGAFALVLECVPEQVATQISEELTIPVIGIGAGAGCDGQVLVYHDVIGYGAGHVPSFVKQYVNITKPIEEAMKQYVQEVKAGTFPDKDHAFSLKENVIQELYGGALT